MFYLYFQLPKQQVLPFIYNQEVCCRVIKASKNTLASSIGNLQLTEGEIILDVDGTVPTQPVLQHIGMSLWPGK